MEIQSALQLSPHSRNSPGFIRTCQGLFGQLVSGLRVSLAVILPLVIDKLHPIPWPWIHWDPLRLCEDVRSGFVKVTPGRMMCATTPSASWDTKSWNQDHATPWYKLYKGQTVRAMQEFCLRDFCVFNASNHHFLYHETWFAYVCWLHEICWFGSSRLLQ